MRRLWLSLACVLTCVTTSGQESPPQILVQAAQCLASKTFLTHEARSSLELGYWIDTKIDSDPVIYVVEYLRPNGAEGYIFTIFEEKNRGRLSLNIQNNGRFRLGASGKSIDFPEEILGGTWTHENVESAIRKIERQPRFTISRDLVFTKPDVGSCHSYADREN